MKYKFKNPQTFYAHNILDTFCSNQTFCPNCPLDELCTNYMDYTVDDKVAKLIELGIIEEVEEDG